MRALFLLLLTCCSAVAQDSTITCDHRYVLKLDIGALVDPDRTVQVGLEFPIGTRTNWQTVVGYGWNNLQGGDLSQFERAEVWRLRNEIRFYTGRYRTNRTRQIAIKAAPPLGNYWALDLLAKQINVTDFKYSYSTIILPHILPPTPLIIGYLTKQRYVLGSHVKIGRQIAFLRSDKTPGKLLLDVFAGAGIRLSRVRQQPRQADYEDLSPGMFDRFGPGTNITPSLTAGLRLGFAL